jgi:hypothetical protein
MKTTGGMLLLAELPMYKNKNREHATESYVLVLCIPTCTQKNESVDVERLLQRGIQTIEESWNEPSNLLQYY